MRVALVLLLAAACASSDARSADAPFPDGAPAQPDARPDAADSPDAPPPPPPLEQLDFRTVRGEPLATTTLLTPTEELFALGDDGFVLRDACSDAPGCKYTWHDDAGTVRRQREHLYGVTATTISSDGRRALLMAADDVGACDRDNERFTVARGTLQVLDLATGAVGFELALRSNPWSAPGFTPDNRWFFAAPIDDGLCLPTSLGYRSVDAPFGGPPGLTGGLDFVQTIDARRWLAFRNFELGVVDPEVPGSFIPLVDSPIRFDVSAGWAHSYEGPNEVVQEIVSASPANEVRHTPVERDEDWFAFGTAGRWVRVCGFRQLPGVRACRVVDVLGERSPVDFVVVDAEDHHEDAVLLVDGAVIFVAPTGDDTRALERLDLTTGRVETLHAGDGELHPLGDGAAVLFRQKGDAWLVEAAREEHLAEQVDFVLTAPRVPFLPLTRQNELAVLVLTDDDVRFTLRVLDLRSRRLATLTDRLLFELPPGGNPFAFGDCSMPWTTLFGGGPNEAFVQDGRHLFFVEQPAADEHSAALWVVPVDLSAPPRRLATLSDPQSCRPPRTSPNGGRVGFLEVDPPSGGVKVTIGTE